MNEAVKALVLKLQDIVIRQTKGKYPNVNKALTSLRDYVQETTAIKKGVEDKLQELEDILYQKGEKKKLCTDQIENIRVAMRLQKKATTGADKSKDKRRTSSPSTSERSTPLPVQTKENSNLRKQSSPATSDRATPSPSQKMESNKLRSDLTQVEENTKLSERIDQNEKEYRDGMADEVLFFVECINGLKAVFSDDPINPMEKIIPVPNGKIKKKVETGYTSVMDVARDISRLKTENQYLRKTLDGLHKYIIGGDEMALDDLKAPKHMKDNQSSIEVEVNVKEVKKKFQETKTDLLGCKQEMARKKKEYEQNYEKLRAEHQKLKTAYTNLEKRCNDTNALSEHAGALLTHDNPSIADLSDPNRPTKLAEKYSELYDNQWTDAFATIAKEDPDISENNIIRYLYGMLVDGYRFCEDVRRKQILALEDILFDPAGGMKTSQRRQKEEMSQRFAKHFNDISNLSSNVTSENLAKAFVMEEKTKDKYSKLLKPCETYIQECVQLCWLMQVQTPPLRLDVTTIQGQSFDKDCYKEYRRRGKEIAFVVWPALFLHETGPVMSKGVAQGQ